MNKEDTAMKKLFALILTVLLAFASLAFPALAETVETVADAPAPAFTVDAHADHREHHRPCVQLLADLAH